MIPEAVRPCVTVVIPCYNQGDFLPSAIKSVREQTYGPVELIVVDDGSTDDTHSIARSLGAIVISQENKGLSQARNVGLAAARGEFIVMLDADDELLPDAVAIGVEALVSSPHAAAVVGNCQSVDADGRLLPAERHVIDTTRLYREWLANNFVWAPAAAMFRRRALEQCGGFPQDLGPAADYAVYLRLARTGTVLYNPKEVARYRQHDASMSRDPVMMLRVTLEVLRRESKAAPASLRSDFRRGRRTWRRWYGEYMIERLRTDWHAGERGAAQVQLALTLLWHCPTMAVREAGRKLRCLLAREESTDPQATPAAPPTGRASG